MLVLGGLGVLLACGGPSATEPELRLCASGQSSEVWMRDRLRERGATAVFDELQLNTPLVWCGKNGSEERGTLRWVVVEKLDVDGERIVRGTKWLERGKAPRGNPRATSWRVDQLAGPEPVSVLLTVDRPR